VASVISESTRQLLRRIAEGVMLDTVTLKHKGARIDKPGGGWEYAPGAETVTIGYIGPVSKSAIERLQADRLEYTGLEELRIPLGVTVSSEDRVTVLSANHGTTRSYTIEAVVPLDTMAVRQPLIVKAVA
jgi:hypothetical protein